MQRFITENMANCVKALQDPESYAFTLMSILLGAYDNEVFEFPPPLLFNQIEKDFRIKFPEENENKVNAAITILTSDLFYTNIDVFKSCALAFADGDLGNIPDGGDEELDVCSAMWAIVEAGLLSGEGFLDSEAKLSDKLVEELNEVVDDEAEDMEEELEEDPDTIKDVMEEVYYQRYVTINLLGLVRQLLSIGVSRDICRKMLSVYGRDLDKLDKENGA